MSKKNIVLLVAGSVGAVFLTSLVLTNLWILRYQKRVLLVTDVPTSTLGLVFGAGVKKDGTPTPMLRDRIYAGVALYKAGKVERLMMTGDDGRMWSDEVDSMRAVAIQLGVPEEKISVDRHGYRTYESCYRESKVYGVTSTIVVSQAFHLPRIMYLCKNFGITSVGVAADLGDYGWDAYWMEVREAGARLKAWWQVNIEKPLPEEPTLKD